MPPPNKPTPRSAPHAAAIAQANDVKLQQALALHRQGQLDQAAVLYQQILGSQAQHFDALQLLATLKKQCHDLVGALALFDQALALDPRHVGVLNNRGNLLRNLQRPQEALASYTLALQVAPDEVDIHNNCGNALSDLERMVEALACYDRVLQMRPDHVEAHYNRGNALGHLDRTTEALASYERALQLNPSNVKCHINHGHALDKLKRGPQALQSYERALQLEPDNPECHTRLGQLLSKLERPAEAFVHFERALQIKPNEVEYHTNLGHVLIQLRRGTQAHTSFTRALQLGPEQAELHNNLGLAWELLRRLPEAYASFQQALQLDPDYAEAYNNMGVVMQSAQRPREALQSYAQAIRLMPDYAGAHINQALCHLSLGDFAPGWQQHEWRWQQEKQRAIAKIFTQALWLGKEDLRGKTIVLHAEQGLGDTIQFCRYVKQVAQLGATVLLAVQNELLPVVANLEGLARLMRPGDRMPEAHYQCPLLSLPLAFGTDLSSISGAPYLQADPHKSALWQAKLRSGQRLKIGMAWSGNPEHLNDDLRSIPFHDWRRIMTAPADFYCIQKEVRDTERALVEQTLQLPFFGDELHDLGDTAALIAALDLVITVDTSVAHLAAAMGKEVWILLAVAPDWRWLLERSDSPWYGSARLFRQSHFGDWDSVLTDVTLALQQRLQTGAAARHVDAAL